MWGLFKQCTCFVTKRYDLLSQCNRIEDRRFDLFVLTNRLETIPEEMSEDDSVQIVPPPSLKPCCRGCQDGKECLGVDKLVKRAKKHHIKAIVQTLHEINKLQSDMIKTLQKLESKLSYESSDEEIDHLADMVDAAASTFPHHKKGTLRRNSIIKRK